MRHIRRIFLLFCLIATFGLVWGAVYARKEGFTRSWRDAIEREFAKRGYYVDIGKLTLGAFRGLVAEDVRFFQDETRLQEIAVIDDVYLDVDLSRVFNEKQISINTLDVQEASLSLPLDPAKPDGRRLRVTGLSGRVVITESVIEIVKAEASVVGMDLSIKGSLVRPPLDEQEEKPVDEKANSARLAQQRRQVMRFLKDFEAYEFYEGRPKVAIEFRGDLDDLATTTARAEVRIPAFSKQGQTYRVDSLAAAVRYDGRSGSAVVESLVIRDAKGALNLTGEWTLADEKLNFTLESTADVASLAALFSNDKKLGEVVFFNPPTLKASGHLVLGGKDAPVLKGFPGEIIGEVRAERFVTRGTVFSGLDFGFSAAGERFYLRNLRLDHKTGVAFLNLKYEPGKGDASVQYQTEIKLDPLVFRPFFDEKGRKFIDAWNFGEASTIYIAAVGQGEGWNPLAWSNRGEVDLRHFRLNGVEFQEMETDFELNAETQWFRNVSLVREEGKIVAELAQNNVKAKQWEVKGVVSTVDPIEGARAFSPKLAIALERYQHSSPPTVRLAGLLDARREEEVGDKPRRNELKISFAGGGNARYVFLGKTLTLTEPTGEVVVDGSRVHLTSLRAGIFGGSFELEYDARNVRSQEQPFQANVRVVGVPLEAVTKHYSDRDAIKGSVDTTFSLAGNAGQITSLSGHGNARISNGYLFAIPVLGPLSKLISKHDSLGEKEGSGVAKEATASFTMTKGVIATDDLEALTQAFRVRAVGTVSLVDKGVDLEAVVNTRGLISRTLLTPVSELLTYSCTGTVTDPIWKPKHISNLAKVPAQVISEMTNIPIEGLKRIGKGIFGPQVKRGETGGPEPGEAAPLRRLFQQRSN